MPENALQLWESAIAEVTTPIECSLARYRTPEEAKRKRLDGESFLWESVLIFYNGNGYRVESQIMLMYGPPLTPRRIPRLFGAKPIERNDSNRIGLEITIRNLTNDRELIRKVPIATIPTSEFHTFDGTNFRHGEVGGYYICGGPLGLPSMYQGEDIRLRFTERLDGVFVFHIPLFGKEDSFSGGGGGFHPSGYIFRAHTDQTKPFEEHIKQLVPLLTHKPSEYSQQLGEELARREAQYFRRHIELLRGFYSI